MNLLGHHQGSPSVKWGACSLLLLVASHAPAQQKLLERDFRVGATSRYRIQLKVRSEVEGSRPVQIGVKTYVEPFSRDAQGQLSWRASRRVVAIDADGGAEIEEVLDDFQRAGVSGSAENEESEKLLQAMSRDLGRWPPTTLLTLHYRETRAGQLLGLTPDGVPPLGEEPPQLLSLWLLRAVRPAAVLPATPIQVGVPWLELRAVQLPNWADVRGSETGEWLEALESSEPAVRLHLVQGIFGTVVSGAEKPPEGTAQARFHGESLNTLSLSDGRLLAAARSALREVTWTLAPIEGLRERPQFRGRLSVEVQIEACNEDPCVSPGSPVLR
jgi:hypothetical protein